MGWGGEGGITEVSCCEGGTVKKNRYVYYETGPSFGVSVKAGVKVSINLVSKGEIPSCENVGPTPGRFDVLIFSITNTGIDIQPGIGFAFRYNLVRGYMLIDSYDTGECCGK